MSNSYKASQFVISKGGPLEANNMVLPDEQEFMYWLLKHLMNYPSTDESLRIIENISNLTEKECHLAYQWTKAWLIEEYKPKVN